MQTALLLCVMTLCAATGRAQSGALLYTNDFSHAAINSVPEDMLVLDGAFAIQEIQSNRVLQLPGAPLDSFGVLFGPASKDGVYCSARVLGTSKGRRSPTFALGLNGVAGYRLQVTPAKKMVELFRGDMVKTNAAFEWTSGTWTHLRVQVQKAAAGWTVLGKAWNEESAEPASWTIRYQDSEEVPPGRASLFGSPFSGTPIAFDDLVIGKIQE